MISLPSPWIELSINVQALHKMEHEDMKNEYEIQLCHVHIYCRFPKLT